MGRGGIWGRADTDDCAVAVCEGESLLEFDVLHAQLNTAHDPGDFWSLPADPIRGFRDGLEVNVLSVSVIEPLLPAISGSWFRPRPPWNCESSPPVDNWGEAGQFCDREGKRKRCANPWWV